MKNISKQQYEEFKILLDARIAICRILKEEKELFILNNILDNSKEDELKLAGDLISKLENMIAEYKDDLFALFEKYNSQFAKSIPTSILNK